MIGDIAAIDWLMWLVRWTHAVSAVAWVGGSIFFAVVLRPVVAANPGLGSQLMGPIASVYKELVDAAVLALVVSGIVLMFDRLTGSEVSPTWFIVLGVKLALASVDVLPGLAVQAIQISGDARPGHFAPRVMATRLQRHRSHWVDDIPAGRPAKHPTFGRPDRVVVRLNRGARVVRHFDRLWN